MDKKEKQEYIIEKLNDIADLAQELMRIAETGEDGNLNEMSYHIKCYTKKIIVHLLHEWKNNEKFSERKVEKIRARAEQKKQEYKEMKILEKQIFQKFMK